MKPMKLIKKIMKTYKTFFSFLFCFLNKYKMIKLSPERCN